jgi:hypothetical protein
VTFSSNSSNPIEAENANAVAEGTYLVVSNDPGNSTPPTVGPVNANGYIYRIGNYVSGTTWQLIPGNDLQAYPAGSAGRPTTEATSTIKALIVGRSIHDPTQPYVAGSNGYEGLSQDISVYVTFVRINS